MESALSHIKQRYGEIFNAARALLQSRLLALRDRYACDDCHRRGVQPELPQGGPKHPGSDALLHAGCGFVGWYRDAIGVIENDVAREVYETLGRIEAYKQTFSCHQCGVCCRFASSEDPYEALLEKAAGGDDFARQFTSVFLPYASTEEARRRFPALVDDVLRRVGADAGERTVHFYHCPYVGEDNRCSIYGTPKRPDICARYPETPLTFVYEKCAWKPWQDETHETTLMAHATLALCEDMVMRLKSVLGNDNPG